MRTTTRLAKTTRTRLATYTAAGLCASVALTGAAVAVQDSTPTETTATETTKTTTSPQAAEATKTTAKAEPKAKDWVAPIADDYTLTATYGNSGDRWASSHSGQDFAVPTGTPVHAVHDGTVVKAGPNGAGDGPAYGNAVVIDHGNGTYTQYAHLNSIDVTTGQKITTNQKIADSGNTGNSSGPHLHFEVRTTPHYGSAIDPIKFLTNEHVTV